MSTWKITRARVSGIAIRTANDPSGVKALSRGTRTERVPSESEERRGSVVQVGQEQPRDEGRQDHDREADEDGGGDGAGDLQAPGPLLGLEDVHRPDDTRVVVEGQGAVEDPRNGEGEVPGVELGRAHRAREEDELREESA